MKRTVLGFLFLLLSSCVYTTLTPEGAKVRITANPDVVRPCTLVGEVKGADHWNGGIAGQGAAEETATRELKNRTAAMGANVVFVTTSHTNTSGSVQRGEAYKCPAPTP